MVVDAAVITHNGHRESTQSNCLRLICGNQLTISGLPDPLEAFENHFLHTGTDENSDEDFDVDGDDLSPRKFLNTLSTSEETEWRCNAFATRVAMAKDVGLDLEALTCDELGLPTWPGIGFSAVARLKRGPD